MKLKVVPASRGLQWAQQGIRLCLSQPLGFVSLLGMIATLVMLMLGFQILGLVLVVIAMPLLWMSFMLATRRVMAGERITPAVLIEAAKAPADRKNWLKLGAMYGLGTLLVTVIAGVLGPDIEALADAVEQASQDSSLLSNPVVQENMIWRLALSLPLSLAFWHTPALVYWGRVPPVKALFFSAVASWRNLGAFVVYGGVWLAILLAAGLVIQVLGSLFAEPVITNILMVFVGMWVGAAFYTSMYFSVVECFEPPQADSLVTPSSEQA